MFGFSYWWFRENGVTLKLLRSMDEIYMLTPKNISIGQPGDGDTVKPGGVWSIADEVEMHRPACTCIDKKVR